MIETAIGFDLNFYIYMYTRLISYVTVYEAILIVNRSGALLLTG